MLINSPDGSVARIEELTESNVQVVRFTLFRTTPQDVQGEGHIEVTYDASSRRKVTIAVRALVTGERDVADLQDEEITDHRFDIEEVGGRDLAGVTASVNMPPRKEGKDRYNAAQKRDEVERGVEINAAVGQYALRTLRRYSSPDYTDLDKDIWQFEITPIHGQLLFSASVPERLSGAEMQYYRNALHARRNNPLAVLPNGALPAGMSIN